MEINLKYQLWLSCERTIEVPDDYVKPEGLSGYALFEDLRKKYPDHEIWNEIPNYDDDGGISLDDHLEYVDGSGLNIQKVFSAEDRSKYTYDDPYGFEYEINF